MPLEMATSDKGREFIEMWEEGGKAKLRPYDDGTGVLTIGFGHTTPAGPPKVVRGMTITADEADRILASDLAAVEVNVCHHVEISLTQAQFDCLVSFDFNTGGLVRSTVLRRVNAGQFDLVPAALMMWVRGGGRVMQGLVRRRKAEGILFSQGKYTT